METLDNIKLLLDIDSEDTTKDGIINLYISRATEYIKQYCQIDEVPSAMNHIVEDIAVFYYRNKGVENISSEGKGSLSETYIKTIPSDILSSMGAYRRIKIL